MSTTDTEQTIICEDWIHATARLRELVSQVQTGGKVEAELDTDAAKSLCRPPQRTVLSRFGVGASPLFAIS